MKYQTKVSVEIEGIRRSIPVEINYRVEMVQGKPAPIHSSATAVCWGKRSSGEWIYDAIGVRQLKELDSQLVEHWQSERGEAA